MIKKICFSPENTTEAYDTKEVLASEHIVSKMTKLAKNLKALAPRSDDFLYFSIIFLKSAEACLIDESGLTKKAANGEDAWGFFDESWKWHGNVQPHRNNNKDIFPESELKKAAADWVGLPLCRDHESSSVDGIRGIILDTHYDEKHKQIVGLCALDRVNYPDLARKVESGLVRYGSMGTAVETSVCSTCGNRAATLDEYCSHITNKTAHGEINVGLKPIEYSLVVQPAEPGAVLLKCIASLQEYKKEFHNYGVGNVDNMLGRLSLKQAQHLEGIMKTACGEGGCSIEERRGIVKGFLDNNGLLKGASERLTSYEDADNSGLPSDMKEYSGVNSRLSMFSGSGVFDENSDFASEEEGLLRQAPQPVGGEPLTSFSTKESGLAAKTASDNNLDDISINSLMEDIMNESRLRKRAELRRRLAYLQGGDNVDDKNYREPDTFKSENYTNLRDKQDKQMTGTYDMGGQESADLERKKKLSRAELEDRRLKRLAYMQGGSEGVEPGTYKSEDYKNYRDQLDKHMNQDGNMGGDSGMFPGDSQVKEHHKRAERASDQIRKSAYTGPSLSTRFSVKKRADGTVDHYGSLFEVFAGDKRVIASTANDIFGSELRDNWQWLRSREYGQEVCRQIRASGLDPVRALLKSAQDMGLPPAPGGDMGLPPAPGGDMGLPPAPGGDMGLPPAPGGDMGPPPGGDMGLPPAPDAEGGEEEEEESPAAAIDSRLTEMEQLLDEVRDLVSALEDERLADVDVNVFTGKDKGEGEGDDAGLMALSSNLSRDLRKVYAQLDESADELSMVAETFDNINKLSGSQRSKFLKLASSAVRDADNLLGETKGLVRVAGRHNQMIKTAGFGDVLNDTLTEMATNPMGALQTAKNYYAGGAADAFRNLASLLEGQNSPPPANSSWADLANAAAEGSGDAVTALMKGGMALGDAAFAPYKGLFRGYDKVKNHYSNNSLDYAMDGSHAPESNDAADGLVSEAMTLRRNRREAILKQAENRMLKARASRRSALLQKSATTNQKPATTENTEKVSENTDSSEVKKALAEKINAKKADEEREAFKVKLRRAYDVGIEMQNKGLLTHTKTALDKQVDEILSFDDRAFEAFKRSIANARPLKNVKVASDLGGLNIGVESETPQSVQRGLTASTLSSLWE